MGKVITSDAISIRVVNIDSLRRNARIITSSIRALVEESDDENIELVFTSDEIKLISYLDVDSINGDTNISSQNILRDKLEAIIFG